jgi:ribonuclease HII
MVRKLIYAPNELNLQNKFVGGIDEVGRGAGAGCVVAACVILPESFSHPDLNDSKKMSKKTREELYPIILKNATSVGIGLVDNHTIDEINILNATFRAMHYAIKKLSVIPDFLLVDGDRFKSYSNIPFKCIVQGDGRIISIAAASVVAKVYRDKLMSELSKKYPNYGWANNSGYLTKEHREAIIKNGLTPEHRRTFINDNLLIKTPKLF